MDDYFYEHRRHNKAMEKQAKRQNKLQEKALEYEDERERDRMRMEQVDNQKERYMNAINLPKSEQFQLYISDLSSENEEMVKVAEGKIKGFNFQPSDLEDLVPLCHSILATEEEIKKHGFIATKVSTILTSAYKDDSYHAYHQDELIKLISHLGSVCVHGFFRSIESDDYWNALVQIPYENDDIIDSFFESVLNEFLKLTSQQKDVFSKAFSFVGMIDIGIGKGSRPDRIKQLIESMEEKLLGQLNCSDISLANIEKWELHLADLREREQKKQEKKEEIKQQAKDMANNLLGKTGSAFSSMTKLFGKK